MPDLTPDDLKTLLAPFLDFSKERSASVHWIDTLPPEMKKAITERHAMVGMDREEVVAAIGKPDRKVRERDAQGNDTEDWIYGHPPDKTVFVQFTGRTRHGHQAVPAVVSPRGKENDPPDGRRGRPLFAVGFLRGVFREKG